MIKVRVPATTANLGPGFDTLGLALDLYNEFTFEEIPSGLEIHGFEDKYRNSNNLVYKSMMETFRQIGYRPAGIRMGAQVRIPISRGLGSSASCILAGVVGANEIAARPLNKDEIFQLATRIEGHPDNISPALYGGFTISIMDGDRPIYNSLEIHQGLRFIGLVPDFTLSTKEARQVLPKTIDYRDGVKNISRVALLLSALCNGRFDLLDHGLQDSLHQPYRGKLIRNFDAILAKAKSLGALGVFLSGAGPTIMCIVKEDDEDFKKDMEEYLEGLEDEWMALQLAIDLQGTRILKA